MAYSPEEIEKAKDLIIDKMIEGESLTSIIDNNKTIPRIRTVFNWLNSDSEYHDKVFLQNYARAQEIRAEREFEEILKIADSTENDIIKNEDGNKITNHNVIQRDRLRVDARKWRISKMQPKKYGNHLDVTSNGKPLQQPNVILPDGMDLDEYLKSHGL